jgi:hypothetical protein
MLHIHNGDSAAGIAKKSNLPGEHIAWREALICGPTPGHLPEDEWRRLRAKHLAGAYGLALEDCENDLRKQEEALAKFSDHEEVVLWFEHDLFCQIHLVYLLNWFAQQQPGQTKLSLICIGEFPGILDFRGLGQLGAEQMTSLFQTREPVMPAELELAGRAWQAYSSSDPGEIATLLADDTSALPFLRAALQKHLARFPSVRNGLGEIENAALESIARGASQFGPLFQEFGKTESIYGLGDAQLMLLLRQLAAAPQPLLTISNGDDPNRISGSDLLKTSFTLTGQGKAVLQGNDDYVALNGIDTWLGGVHLAGQDAAWRWDEQQSQLIRNY